MTYEPQEIFPERGCVRKIWRVQEMIEKGALSSEVAVFLVQLELALIEIS